MGIIVTLIKTDWTIQFIGLLEESQREIKENFLYLSGPF